MKSSLLSILLLLPALSFSQVNIISTNPVAEQVLLGNYNPSTYFASTILNRPDTISKGINNRVSPDTLKSFILKLASFRNRNTGSDTISTLRGIGAARRWVFSKFQQFSAQNENRLLVSYLQFDTTICGMRSHRDVFAVLPGMDTADNSVIFIEGHMDSRCEGLCDTACTAEGVEDNSSGTALVMELARVMSRYSYNHTIVFLVTIGEEQGLFGASAFAMYAQQKNIPVKSCQNNDVIGGIICGATSSPPGCPGLNNIDSLHVRFFSYGGYNSPLKGLARFVKLEYKEMLLPYVSVPMTLNIMTPEDRSGRSGDHVPFRQHSFTAMRFTSANEHGDANVSNVNYTDRQHTTRDTLGADTNNDMVVDSFFVDFDYLARNAVINGNGAGLTAIGPEQPDFQLTSAGGYNLRIQVTQQTQYPQYRVGVRTTTHDWDSVYTMTGTLIDTIVVNPANVYYVSVMSVDTNGLESLPSREYMISLSGINELNKTLSDIQLLQNHPNPFDEATTISVLVNKPLEYKTAYISVKDMQGREITRLPVSLNKGMNEVYYTHGYHASGSIIYSLVIDGKIMETRQMVFAN